MPAVDPLATAFLLVETTAAASPVWAVKWRAADGTRVKRRLGAPAWLERDGRRLAPATGSAPSPATSPSARRAG